MPEGDTVYLTAQRLDQALSGQVLTVSDLRVPQLAEVSLVGRTVDETVSRGKHLLTRIGDVTLHTHLMMDGSWHIYRPTSRWRSPAFQARVVLANASWQAVGFRLGVVELLRRDDEAAAVGQLGPDLLGPDWDLAEAVRRLTADPDVPIGEALLDQRNLAGVGNMYKAEICFLHGVHPGSAVGEVVDLPRLVERARQILEVNRDRAAQSTTGDLRRGHTMWVYGRGGQPCRRCGTPVEQGRLPSAAEEARRALRETPDQERARESFWCPTCQPLPHPAE